MRIGGAVGVIRTIGKVYPRESADVLPLTENRSSQRPETIAAWPVIVALLLVAIGIYANSLWNGFAYDDEWIILRNDRIHQLEDLKLIWGTPYWPTWGRELGLYRPLTIFSYALQWAAADGQPWIFHAVNVGLHALNTLLVFALLRMFAPVLPAALGALVFAVHPVHTEAVANSVGQAELLAAAFMLSACLVFLNRPPFERVSLFRILCIAALYVLALFAKEGAIVLPVLLVLVDIARRRLAGQPHRVISYLSHTWMLMFVLAAGATVYLSIRTDVLGSFWGLDAGPHLPFLREEYRVLNAFRAWPEYARLLFFPKELSADYLPAVILPVQSLTPMTVLGASLLAITIILGLLTPFRPEPGLPAAWFFVTILTVSNLLFPVGVVVAERTMYMPTVAVALIVGFAAEHINRRASLRLRHVAAMAFVLGLGLMSYRTFQRNREWKSTAHILGATVRDHPESYRSAWILADLHWRRGDLDRSTFYWEAAIRLWPRDSQLLSEYGNFNIGRGQWKRAIQMLERARALHAWIPRTHELLALAYVHDGRYAEALRAADEVVRLGKNSTLLFAIRARAYEGEGRLPAAIGAWRNASQGSRTNWIHRAFEARALARSGDAQAALAVADSGALSYAADSVASAYLKDLRTSVANGCYSQLPPADCRDPLAAVSLLSPQTVLRPAKLPT
jgi:protein O-mannosyl-transferase